jgi:hypothetical protein
MAEMWVTIYGGAADIHSDITGIYRFKDAFFPFEGIVEK